MLLNLQGHIDIYVEETPTKKDDKPFIKRRDIKKHPYKVITL
jgi:hypothetical protein